MSTPTIPMTLDQIGEIGAHAARQVAARDWMTHLLEELPDFQAIGLVAAEHAKQEAATIWNELPIDHRMGCSCCANPNHVTTTDSRGRWISKCQNCGAHC